MNSAETILAPSKINLFLRIIGKRKDGYHNIESLFYPVPRPFDLLHIRRTADIKGFRLICSQKHLQQENILYQAYDLFGRKFDYWPALEVELEKNIPVGSGLGGASSDAAALINYLFDLYIKDQGDANILFPDKQQIVDIAAEVGADVPFFILNKPAWVTGIGEKLTFVQPVLSGLKLFIICPQISISTAKAYKEWDKNNSNPSCSQCFLTNMPGRIKSFYCLQGQLLFNSFEAVVFKDFSELQVLKSDLLASGAAAAVLSGSGSAIAGLCRDEQQVRRVQDYLHRNNFLYFLQDI